MMTGIKTSITRDKRPGKYIMLPDTLADDEMILVQIAMIEKIIMYLCCSMSRFVMCV